MRFDYATPEATYQFAKRFSHYKEFYTKHKGLVFSKLGLGTYKIEPYKEENYTFDYKEALKTALSHGINFIDTALSYRYQESEKEIGEVLESLFNEGTLKREEVIVSSKGGFIPLEFPFPKNPYEWIDEHIVQKGLATREDIELDQHCMTPLFLKDSLERSLRNLRISCLDIYFLHNPETQLTKMGKARFLEHIEAAFAFFETCVHEGKIKSYGIAVWNAFTYDESNVEHINLEEVYDIALKVGGANHHFAYIQLPFNLSKSLAYSWANQKMNDGAYYTPLQVAHKLGIGVIGSSSLLQMHLFQKPFKESVHELLDESKTLATDVQYALQFVRSTRGLVSSLFGSTHPEFVKSNLAIARVRAAKLERYDQLYTMDHT